MFFWMVASMLIAAAIIVPSAQTIQVAIYTIIGVAIAKSQDIL